MSTVTRKIQVLIERLWNGLWIISVLLDRVLIMPVLLDCVHCVYDFCQLTIKQGNSMVKYFTCME